MTQNILYIEDNEDNMQLVKKLLISRGYDFHPAVNGKDGLALAEDVQPDLILLDINLPDIDGYEVARQIRLSSSAKLKEVPIIAITAHVLAGDAEKALDSGCDIYMAKPFNVRELWMRVESYFQDK